MLPCVACGFWCPFVTIHNEVKLKNSPSANKNKKTFLQELMSPVLFKPFTAACVSLRAQQTKNNEFREVFQLIRAKCIFMKKINKTEDTRATRQVTSGQAVENKYNTQNTNTYSTYFPTQSRPEPKYLSYRGIISCVPVSKKSVACMLSHVAYCETLKMLLRTTQNERCGMMTSGAVLLHDSACQHISNGTRALQKHFNWELFDHPPLEP
jgi:hypothetical protein